ncbi:SIMPL domain-containing protein [Pseudoalteromonas sp. S3776]|uniref:SIMPL domain-containing protein n=1 Tax=Pseudoalteromonas sp. S3776 TaxID=579544 RepID=UPI001109C245|nr:SIMPL domain-containing protein [Pseudoalteromonas sp. S3776]TMO77515.1 SIMPL domain-containing protein [Pseudoalteromonas sp. S3776]
MKLITTIFLTLLPVIAFANSSLPANRHISVQGTAEVLVEPDMAKILFKVNSVKNEPKAANNALENKVKLLIDGLNQFEISADDVVASNVKIEKTGMDYIETGHQALSDYSAIRTFEVTLNSIERVSDLTDFLLNQKVNAIQNIEFLSSKYEQLQAQATQLAIKDAKIKAGSLADSFNAKVGEVRTIRSTKNNYDSGFSTAISKMHRAQQGNNSFPQIRSNDLQATISFKSSINVVFDLEVDD